MQKEKSIENTETISEDERNRKNPLGEEKINRLLRQFAVPSIISMLVGSLYNIVDQFFIGQSVGELGNAATNIFTFFILQSPYLCTRALPA